MKVLTVDELEKAILETGRYETPPDHLPKKAAKCSSLSSVRYAFTIIAVVAECSIKHIFRKFDYEAWKRATVRTIAFAEKVGSRVSIEGFGNRKAYSGPVVYVMNHMSILETMAAPPLLLMFGKLSVILKKSIDQFPFVGKASRAVGHIAVTRTNPREDLVTVLTEGCKRIKGGSSVLIFPQGTRQAVFDHKRFNSLGVKLAVKAGVPVVPVAVESDILKTGKWIRDFGQVDPSRPLRFECGPVLPVSLGPKLMQEQSLAFIEGTLKKWGLPTV